MFYEVIISLINSSASIITFFYFGGENKENK